MSWRNELCLEIVTRDELVDATVKGVVNQLGPLLAKSLNERLLDGIELAERLGVSWKFVERWSARGLIPSIRLGTGKCAMRRYIWSDVVAAFKALTPQQPLTAART